MKMLLIFLRVSQSLRNVLNERFTLKNLILKDKVLNERKSLKNIILEMENEVLANAGVDVFEEVFKLIFTKLYDESLSQKDKEIIKYVVPYKQDYESFRDEVAHKVDDKDFRTMDFRNIGQTDAELMVKIQNLFDNAKEEWPGVFPEGSTFDLSDSHLSICVSSFTGC